MKTTTSKIDGTVSSPSASLADRPKLPSATRYISLILLVLFLLSVIWTSFLGVLNYVPNATANYLMNTSSFDDGDFWQLSDPSPLHARAAFTGITLNGFGYVYLVLLVTRLATTTASGSASNPRPTFSTRLFRLGHKRARRRLPVPGQRVLAEMRAFYYELVSHDGKHRKNLLFEIIEVVIQTITLHELLSDGLHQSLIILYVSLMVINCVCCFYHITCAWKQHAYDELVADAMLDIVFAVVFPAVVLVQAVRAYRTDLRAMQIRQNFFPAQPYGRRARIYSDPGQINSFTAAFDNLRITSPLDVVAKIGFNLLTCLRWRRIALTLRAKRRKDNTGAQNAPNKGKNHGIGPVIPNLSPCRDNLEVQVSYRPVPPYVGILFLLYGALAAAYTYGALSMSNLACAPYATTCVLYAYQWSPSGEASLCPCLVFIERDMSPSIRTWLSLSDLSQNLSLLAEAGMLRTVQVMNRGMNYALPKHLMQCSDIRHLILINTDVEELPEWMVYAFPKLEYLHIEGQPRGNCITSLPDKLFSGMPTLRTLSLSRHRVFTVPPFDGLVSLRTMYLGDVPFIPELPPLEPLHHLQTLGLVQIRNLAYLPELSSLAPTLRSVYIQYAPLCCSGFLSEGNTSYPGCSTYHVGTCYPQETESSEADAWDDASNEYPLISDGSRRILSPFLDSGSVCRPDAGEVITSKPRLDPDNDQCQGVLYRRCRKGICYNQDLAVVLCLNASTMITMRQAEIRLGVPCNATEEAWLGCLETR